MFEAISKLFGSEERSKQDVVQVEQGVPEQKSEEFQIPDYQQTKYLEEESCDQDTKNGLRSYRIYYSSEPTTFIYGERLLSKVSSEQQFENLKMEFMWLASLNQFSVDEIQKMFFTRDDEAVIGSVSTDTALAFRNSIISRGYGDPAAAQIFNAAVRGL